MLKPFYNKKKNIDDRLLPDVTVEDAGKVLGVNAQGKFEVTESKKSKKYYQHNISITNTLQGNVYFSFITDDATPLSTIALFNDAMTALGFTTRYLPAGCAVNKVENGKTNEIRFLTGVRKGTSYSPGFRLVKITYAVTDGVLTTTLTESTTDWDSNTRITDKVVEL